jgi:glyoxylase-like metal-dependent hydrolase (beta-lactamase superfamily II)
MAEEPFEVYVIEYAKLIRDRSIIFLGGDPKGGPQDLSGVVYLIIGRGRKILIDGGFKQELAKERKADWKMCPSDAIKLLGVQPEEITDLILTHFHYDHSGNLEKFPNARIYIQKREMDYILGPAMGIRQAAMRNSIEIKDTHQLIERLYKGQVEIIDGYEKLFGAIELHRVGGHSPGQQVVCVPTKRGTVVLASDVAHLYENINEGRPFWVFYDLGEVFTAFKKVRSLASEPDLVVPGHDPKVMEQYPAPSDNLKGIVASLHEKPAFSVLTPPANY